MKKRYTGISNRIQIVGFSRREGRNEVIDYYLVNSRGEREYAFTRRYTRRTYEMVKGGISVKRLLQTRSKDKMVMRLVNYLSMMMPYFMDEIEWIAA